MVTKDDVAHLATLARIRVPDGELESLAKEMDAILGYVEDVRELAGDGVPEPEHALRNVMREDVVTNKPGSYTQRIVAQFPASERNALKVKKIL